MKAKPKNKTPKAAKENFVGLIVLLIVSVAGAPFALYELQRWAGTLKVAETTDLEEPAGIALPVPKLKPHHTHTKDAAETAKYLVGDSWPNITADELVRLHPVQNEGSAETAKLNHAMNVQHGEQ